MGEQMEIKTRIKHRGWPHLIIILAFLFAIVPYISAQEPKSSSLLQIQVDTAYDDSERSLQLISRLIKILPPIRAKIDTNDNLSSFILRNYAVSNGRGHASYLPKTYQVLEDAIVRLNKITNPNSISIGEIYTPCVPKRAFPQWNSMKAINQVPKIQLLDTLSEKVKPDISFFDGQIKKEFISLRKIDEENRAGAQKTNLLIPFDEKYIDYIMQDTVLSRSSTPLGYSMLVELADVTDINNVQDSVEHHRLFDENTRTCVQKFISDNRLRETIIFIADTGWPSIELYKESRRLLRQVFDSAWDYLGSARPNRGNTEKEDKNFISPTNDHCVQIESALEEFRAMDPNGWIKIIYVPLIKEQSASRILEEMITIYYVAINLSTGLGEVAPSESFVKARRDEARDSIKGLPKNWGKIDGNVKTNKNVVEALLWVANLYALQQARLNNMEENATAIFINESWTVPQGRLYVNYPSSFWGLVVAAVGNKNINVNKNGIEFAQRCLDNKDTIAIMNMNKSGEIQSESSVVDSSPDAIKHVMAVGFDGSINKDASATSFAAPRVAWFLAASEVVRKEKIERHEWKVKLFEKLKGIRPDGNGLSTLWFDPIKFLGINCN